MKKMYFLLFNFLFFVIQNIYSQQIAFSSDFEVWSNSFPVGWGGTGTTLPIDSISPYTSNPHSGTKACKLINRSSTALYLYANQSISLKKGHKYEIKFWLKGKGACIFTIGTELFFTINLINNPSNVWKEFTKTFIAQSDSQNVFINFRVLKTDSSYEHLQMDDLIIYDYGLFQTRLDTNNISALISANGCLFMDLMNNPKFEVPKGSGKSTIFSAGLWLGGLDNNNNLHTAVVRFLTGVDFQTGPIAYDYTTNQYLSKYHRVWKINKSDIDYHIMHYNDNNYVMPEAIASWPGNGNVNNGESFILAPFVDINQNGSYEPHLGDYPLIRGDQAIFFILNDDITHTESQGRKFGIEMHVMAYAYNNVYDSALYNTIFLTYNIFNRSDTTYHEVYLGMWTDGDIGDSYDDYVACDSLHNFYLFYNGDENDGDGTGITYGVHPPAQGVAFLSHSMSSFMYFNNGACVMCDPFNAIEYYNYLRGYWKDGTHLTYGDSGYAGNSFSNYAYNGLFYNGWDELSANRIPFDRRGVGTAGPFILHTNSNLCIDFAFPFARDYTGTAVSSAFLLRQRVQEIKNFYDNQNFQCWDSPYGINSEYYNNIRFSVLPNPSNGTFKIKSQNYECGGTIKIYNTLGKCVYTQKFKENEFIIDLNKEPSGMYYYSIFNERGERLKNDKIIICK